MNEENRELLGQVTKNRLEKARDADPNTEEGKVAFKEAMEAVDRELNMMKIDNSSTDALGQLSLERTKAKNSQDELIARREMDAKRQTSEDEHRKKESKRNFWIRVVEIGTAAVVAPVIGYGIKKGFAKMICTFEKDYTFTTTAGRSFGSFFRFKD